ncbi:MAG: M1 family aminopeptidase [Acidobacteriota bacterium]
MMRRGLMEGLRRASCVGAWLLPGVLAALSVSAGDLTELNRLTETLASSRFDVTRAAKVENLVLERDRATITLTGHVFVDDAPPGKKTTAKFFGDGRFQVEPPIKMEREQVERRFKSTEVDETFREATFYFTSASDRELFAGLDFQAEHADLIATEKSSSDAREAERRADWWRTAEKSSRRKLESGTERMLGFLSRELALRLLDDSEDGSSDLLLAAMQVTPDAKGSRTEVLEDLVFLHDSRRTEQSQVTATYTSPLGSREVLVTSFSNSREYRGRYKWAGTSPRLEKKKLDEAVALSHELVLDLKTRGWPDIHMTARSRIRIVEEGLVHLRLSITPHVEVLGAKIDGRAVDFSHPRLPGEMRYHAPEVVVALPRPMAAGEELTLELTIQGGILKNLSGDRWWVRDEDRWYPTPSPHAAPAQFDTTILVRKGITGVANGLPKPCRSDDEQDDKSCFRFVTEQPIDLATFIIAKNVKEHRGQAPDGTPIVVYSPKDSFIEGSEEEHVEMVSEILGLYSEWLGPYPYGRLAVFPHPKRHARGMASLLLLMSSDSDWEQRHLIAHELAHQWWGGVVGIRSGRDQWFSEGFADYMAALYIEHRDRQNGTDLFPRVMATWARPLVARNGRLTKPYPLALANRFQSSSTRQTFMYQKGCYVLHMLRIHAQQAAGGIEEGDALFRKALLDFFETHRFDHPSNLDLVKSFSASLGSDLTWFFRQWVFERGLPVLEYSHEVVDHPDGGHLLRCRIKQKGDPFKFSVGVFFETSQTPEGRRDGFRQWIDRADQTFEVGPLPAKPEKLRLNDDLSLLCLADEVEWAGATPD